MINSIQKTNPGHRRILRLMMALLFLLVGHSAMAAPCTSAGGSYLIGLPTSVAVPRDTPEGGAITNWVESVRATDWFTKCKASGSLGAGIAFQPSLTPVSPAQTFTDGSGTYTVYSTGQAGVGIVLSAELFLQWDSAGSACVGPGGFWTTSWLNISPTGGSYSGWINGPPAPWSGGGCSNGANGQVMNYGGVLRARLVKTGPITPGVVNGQTVAETGAYSNGLMETGTPYIPLTIPAIQISVTSCTTPADTTVDLGRRPTTDFAGPGTPGSNTTSFNISLTGCPIGLGTGIGGAGTIYPAIQYRLEPQTTVVNSGQAVVALDSASTATGVGVQILDGSGAPVVLNTFKTYSGYDASLGGDYNIPFKARYYQTGATVGEGTANTYVMFTMLYQ